MATEASAITEIVSDTVREQISESVVDSVFVESGRDSDGEPVLAVTIVLKKGASPDKRKMVGLVRHIRSRLIGEEAFPIVSFVSKQEAKKLRREAA